MESESKSKVSVIPYQMKFCQWPIITTEK